MKHNNLWFPKVGDRVVVSDWHQFKTTVSCIEEVNAATLLHLKWEFPDENPEFPNKVEYSKVYLHDQGKTWHKYGQHPLLN